jgi:hypothetical protein
VAYGNGVFVTLSYSNTNSAVSADGITWTSGTIASNTWIGVAFGNGVFSAVANTGTAASSSTDGYTWTARTNVGAAKNAVTYGNNSFLAISNSDASTSPDGVTWTLRSVPSTAQWTAVAFGAGKFVMVDRTSTNTNAATIDYAINATSFVLPVVAPKAGTTAYVKAT